jgi:hypothetical protein
MHVTVPMNGRSSVTTSGDRERKAAFGSVHGTHLTGVKREVETYRTAPKAPREQRPHA